MKVGGSRFYFLRGQVARMQIAMLTMAVDQAEEHGFTLAITPTLVRPEVMRGTGFLNSHADEIYRLREPDDQVFGRRLPKWRSPACTRTGSP